MAGSSNLWFLTQIYKGSEALAYARQFMKERGVFVHLLITLLLLRPAYYSRSSDLGVLYLDSPSILLIRTVPYLKQQFSR
jgi:hypothetical protein